MLHLYLDESGDHSLRHIQPSHPLFVLGGVILADDDAVAAAEAAMAAFKRRWFGAERVVLHTAERVRNRGAFARLKDVGLRSRFFEDLNDLLVRLEFSLVACAVRKDAHLERYGDAAIGSLPARAHGARKALLLLYPIRRRARANRRRAAYTSARS